MSRKSVNSEIKELKKTIKDLSLIVDKLASKLGHKPENKKGLEPKSGGKVSKVKAIKKKADKLKEERFSLEKELRAIYEDTKNNGPSHSKTLRVSEIKRRLRHLGNTEVGKWVAKRNKHVHETPSYARRQVRRRTDKVPIIREDGGVFFDRRTGQTYRKKVAAEPSIILGPRVKTRIVQYRPPARRSFLKYEFRYNLLEIIEPCVIVLDEQPRLEMVPKSSVPLQVEGLQSERMVNFQNALKRLIDWKSLYPGYYVLGDALGPSLVVEVHAKGSMFTNKLIRICSKFLWVFYFLLPEDFCILELNLPLLQ